MIPLQLDSFGGIHIPERCLYICVTEPDPGGFDPHVVRDPGPYSSSLAVDPFDLAGGCIPVLSDLGIDEPLLDRSRGLAAAVGVTEDVFRNRTKVLLEPL